MGSRLSLPALVLATLPSFPAHGVAQARLAPIDRAAIAAEIDRMVATARHAWGTRNASLLIPDSTLSVRTPDGGTLDAVQMRAELQRRMSMTTRVDTLIEVLDSVRVITADSVLAYSAQRFVRAIRLDGGAERQRISTMIHERPVVRVAGQWRMTGAVREISRRAWWVDEPPAAHSSNAPSSPVVDSLLGLDSAWARTYTTHDTALATTLLADRFMMTTSDGRIKDKAGELADVRPVADLHMHHFRTSEVRIEIYAAAGLVSGVADWAFTYRGRRSAIRRRYTALYVRGGPLGWQLAGLHMGSAQ